MVDIVKQTIDFFIRNWTIPKLSDIKIKDKSLLQKKWCIFITLYKNWEIRGSAWNIKEIEENIVYEIINSTIDAMNNDTRFEMLWKNEIKWIKIRLDIIKERKTIKEWFLKKLDPVKYWTIAIKKDYTKLAVILPNISPNLLIGKDFYYSLEEKLEEKFDEKKYILYEITTKIFRNY